MSLYEKRVKEMLQWNKSNIQALKKHKRFYPLVEELSKVSGRLFFTYQKEDELQISVYLGKGDDKTLSLFIEEYILNENWIEKTSSYSKKESGEYIIKFQSKDKDSNGDRLRLVVTVNYSALCKRVLKGTEVVDKYEYDCG